MLKRISLILSVVYVIFISLFALDSLSDPVGLVIHLIPSLIFIGMVVFAYNKPKTGGFLILLLGTAFTIFFDTYESFLTFFTISFPVFAIGSLFLFSLKYSARKALFLLFLEALVFLLVLSLYTFCTIGSTIGKTCNEYSIYQRGNCLENIYYYFDFTDDFEKKNHLIWVVGQFGSLSSAQFLLDARASSVCNEEDMKHTDCISSSILDKSIKWCTTNKNKLSPIWRFLYL